VPLFQTQNQSSPLKQKIENPFRFDSINIDSRFELSKNTISDRNLKLEQKLSSTSKQSTSSSIFSSISSRTSSNEAILARALDLMNSSKLVLDSSRLLYEAALLFDDLEAFERASSCYLKVVTTTSFSTSFSTPSPLADPENVVDTYDLPCDEAYKRKVERISKTKICHFLSERKKQRNFLIKIETDRQRLRVN
jgi:hypothetical protein